MRESPQPPFVNFSHQFPKAPFGADCSDQLALRAVAAASTEFLFWFMRPANFPGDDPEAFEVLDATDAFASISTIPQYRALQSMEHAFTDLEARGDVQIGIPDASRQWADC